MDKSLRKDHISPHALAPEVHKNPGSLKRDTASEYTPKAYIVADYIMWVNIYTMHALDDHLQLVILFTHCTYYGRFWQPYRNKGSESVCCHHVITTSLCRKYPEISCVEEREKYKAVFNDQYQEYKDLHRDISTTFNKFRELDAMMARLLRDGKSQEVRGRCRQLFTYML